MKFNKRKKPRLKWVPVGSFYWPDGYTVDHQARRFILTIRHSSGGGHRIELQKQEAVNTFNATFPETINHNRSKTVASTTIQSGQRSHKKAQIWAEQFVLTALEQLAQLGKLMSPG
jgi:hypothetical protein